MISLIIKQLKPLIQSQLENGKIDELLHQMVADCSSRHKISDNETIDIVLSFEDDAGKWFVSFVATNDDNVVRPLESMELKKVIDLILSKI